MRNEDFNEIDQLFRSKLEDAEVKAPRGVWQAVSARLAQPAAASLGWIKWAGAGLAFAAALATGLFFVGTLNKPSLPDNSLAILTDIDNSNQPLTPQTPSDDAEPEVAEHPKTWNGNVPPRMPVLSDRALDIPDGKATETADGSQMNCSEQAAPGKDEAPASDTKVQKEKKWKQTEPMTEAQAWAAIELEESRSKFRPHAALALDGTLGGNDSDLLNRNGHTGHMSFGNTTVKQTGIEEKSTSSYFIPFGVGLGVRIYFAPKLSIGTGLDYTLLSRSFTGTFTQVDGGVVTKTIDGDIRHNMQYLGIPLNLYYDILSGGKAKLYVYAGGKAEYCFSNNYTVKSEFNWSNPVKGLQYSVDAGLGVEFKRSRNLGLYLDPSINYYFHCDHPKNLRTEKPLMVDLKAGLRFDFGNGR